MGSVLRPNAPDFWKVKCSKCIEDYGSQLKKDELATAALIRPFLLTVTRASQREQAAKSWVQMLPFGHF